MSEHDAQELMRKEEEMVLSVESKSSYLNVSGEKVNTVIPISFLDESCLRSTQDTKQQREGVDTAQNLSDFKNQGPIFE